MIHSPSLLIIIIQIFKKVKVSGYQGARVPGCQGIGKRKSQRFDLSLRISGDLSNAQYPAPQHPSTPANDAIVLL